MKRRIKELDEMMMNFSDIRLINKMIDERDRLEEFLYNPENIFLFLEEDEFYFG